MPPVRVDSGEQAQASWQASRSSFSAFEPQFFPENWGSRALGTRDGDRHYKDVYVIRMPPLTWPAECTATAASYAPSFDIGSLSIITLVEKGLLPHLGQVICQVVGCRPPAPTMCDPDHMQLKRASAARFGQ
jgi:hypothetical protein